MRRLAILLIGAFVAAPVSAQRSAVASPGSFGHTDFSGTWNLDLSSVDAETASMVVKSLLTIMQDAKTLTIRTAMTTTDGPRAGSVTYHLDSEWKDTVIQAGVPVPRTSSARWEGAVLVIKTKTERDGQPFDLTARYSIDSTHTALTNEQNINRGGRENHFTQVYRKASPSSPEK